MPWEQKFQRHDHHGLGYRVGHRQLKCCHQEPTGKVQRVPQLWHQHPVCSDLINHHPGGESQLGTAIWIFCSVAQNNGIAVTATVDIWATHSKYLRACIKNFGRNLFIGGRCWALNHWPLVMKATVLPTNPPLISSNNEVWPFYVSAHNMSINNSEEDLKIN